ncbi:hypothetical protein GDO78_019084, partial [Eleutherodactylus coqui]
YLNSGSDPLEVDAKFWELRDSIVQCELLMLRLLHFRVSFIHPHKVSDSEPSPCPSNLKEHVGLRAPIVKPP